MRALCWGLLLVILPVTRVASQTPDREADLAVIRREIGKLESRLQRLKLESSGLEFELRQTELELELQERQVEEARAERMVAEQAVRWTEGRARQLGQDLEQSRVRLKARLADLYRTGRGGTVRSILALESGDNIVTSLRWLRYLVRREAIVVEEYLSARRALLAEREKLAFHRREVEALVLRETERLLQLERTRRLQRRALTVLRGEETGLAQRAGTLADKERKLSLLIEMLAGRQSAPAGGPAIQSFKGALDWPIHGQVVKGFGPRADERYGTRVPHNGLEISAPPGKKVQVVFPGTAVFAAPFEDFGLTAVVHHRNRVFSLYAGLGSLQIAKGDVLSFADVVGVAQENIYFELRVENQPQNPLHWLR
jgi:septal ring factor EnvC (AmiA/AmiB activator)